MTLILFFSSSKINIITPYVLKNITFVLFFLLLIYIYACMFLKTYLYLYENHV